MDVIRPIEFDVSNEHMFILVAIDYFTKWVEAASYKVVTKKVVAYFVWDRIICRFGVPESIITDNAANFNSDLMKAMYETFNIKHQNSTAYRPQMNGDEESASKNIKKILRKMMDNYNQWHERYNILCLGTAPQFVRQLGQHLIYYSTAESQGHRTPTISTSLSVSIVLGSSEAFGNSDILRTLGF
uniref:Integrase catalytic domain-containing protein n=1 Tax=Nicotiana tabacum TaxID=4097 RepID=A0A1S3WYR2_TOBAC